MPTTRRYAKRNSKRFISWYLQQNRKKRGQESDPLQEICRDNLAQFLGEFTDTGINDIYKSYNASFVESSCGVFDGVDDVISFDDLIGVTIVSSEGTATPTITGNNIECTAGTMWDLVLSNGSIYPFSETAGTTIYDVSGNGNHGTAQNIDESTFWGTQDAYHRNITEGFSLYTHATEADIRVSYGNDGKPLTITPPNGYTKASDNPAGNWHNNAETKVKQPEETELINADSGIDFWFDGAGNAVAKSYSELQFDVFDLDPKHKVFADVSVNNKYKNIFTYSTAQSGECLNKAYKLINDNILRDASGIPLLDENDEIIRT